MSKQRLSVKKTRDCAFLKGELRAGTQKKVLHASGIKEYLKQLNIAESEYSDDATLPLTTSETAMSDVPSRRITVVENAPRSLSPEELEFFKTQTGLGEEELKKHINDIQAKAYQVFPYPCIKSIRFTKCVFSSLIPTYPSALRLAKERKDAIWLDVGCCVGCDLRKVVADGWPVENVVGFELRKAFWDYGHELFFSTPESFPATFVAGDVFDPEMISPRTPPKPSEALPPRPDFKLLTSLTPLQGHVSAIYASSFFHLFDGPGQLQVARQLASLLSPLPGSIIFGGHLGSLVKETIKSHNHLKFLHSPESWKDLWEGQVFEKGEIRVDTHLVEVARKSDEQPDAEEVYWLAWSIISYQTIASLLWSSYVRICD